ncbi:hypothetical protein F5880DRAFT_1593392 [Lentinula raphanica]|nr:hypothetical protein F5880DRAFT_1593392 [Lentinula raphanica]
MSYLCSTRLPKTQYPLRPGTRHPGSRVRVWPGPGSGWLQEHPIRPEPNTSRIFVLQRLHVYTKYSAFVPLLANSISGSALKNAYTEDFRRATSRLILSISFCFSAFFCSVTSIGPSSSSSSSSSAPLSSSPLFAAGAVLETSGSELSSVSTRCFFVFFFWPLVAPFFRFIVV